MRHTACRAAVQYLIARAAPVRCRRLRLGEPAVALSDSQKCSHLATRNFMGGINKRRKVASPGCEALTSIEHEQYGDQLAKKTEYVEKLFNTLDCPALEVFESVKEHYRQRVEFRVWQNKEDIYFIMFEKVTSITSCCSVSQLSSKPKAAEDAQTKRFPWERKRVTEFPVASEVINELMTGLIAGVRDNSILRRKLFQANFHSTLAGSAMVTLVYHKHLDDDWSAAAEELLGKLSATPAAKGQPVSLIGRSKNQKICLGDDFVLERMPVHEQILLYKQVEGGFSQPNGHMCQKMLEWAHDVTHGSQDKDLLELYCGNGNFTVALAGNFREVLATEISKASVAAAKYNLDANGVGNVHIARVSSEEFTQAWRGEREFFRMKDLPPVKDRPFQTLLVDPPRAGLDDKTISLLQHFDNIVYISCNPDTLHKNLSQVADTHRIERFALFDQFPYTEHIELGAYVSRKSRDSPGPMADGQ